jgi:hypothetical protein
MGMDEKALRSELVKTPQPARILVRVDGEDREVAGAGKAGRTWAAVARTIMALEPELVQLFDDQGTLLRAVHKDQSTVEVPATAAGATYAASPLHADPETARLVHFANLLSDAWRFSTGIAFQKIVELQQQQTDRAIALEQRMERAETLARREMKERMEDLYDEAEAMREAAQRGDAAGARSIFESFLEGMMGGQAEAKHDAKHANGNGAAKS